MLLPTRQNRSSTGEKENLLHSPRNDDSQAKNRGGRLKQTFTNALGNFGMSMPNGRSKYRNRGSSTRKEVPGWISLLVKFIIFLNAASIGIVLFLGNEAGGVYLTIALFTVLCSFFVAIRMSDSILSADCGTKEMQKIADTIKEGASGFLRVQYYAVFFTAVVFSIGLGVLYLFRPAVSEELESHKTSLALFTSFSFLLGASCSALAGYVGVWFSVRANVRVASAASRGLVREALVIAFRGGAVSAILSAGMCILGVSLLYIAAYINFSYLSDVDPKKLPLFIAGYGFGASFVGLFMQLGGGIYTKAADVGADLVGKIENRIPEDDPRNPAVIADLVGDNVGDCAGSMADVFESISGEIIGAMILGGELAAKSGVSHPEHFVFFPVLIHAADLVVSITGIYSVGKSSRGGPLKVMQNAYVIAIASAIVTYGLTCWFMLSDPIAPDAWFHYFLCGLVGIISSFCLFLSTQYYTDYSHGPVQKIAAASTTGHGTNVIAGVSVGMESSAIPTFILSVSILCSYYLGANCGLPNRVAAGLYGTACATMGTLCTAVFILSMNNFGPIADNAGGIVEMSGQPESVREITDELDAVGNVTKAATKGYAVGGSALACFVLFRAFLDEMSDFIGEPFYDVNIGKIEVLVGGMLGIMSIFLFVGLAIDAVGVTAKKVVEEVRRQLDNKPGILKFEDKPDYQACVAIVTSEALRRMVKPAFFALGMPIIVGIVFRFIGEANGQYTLGVEVLCGLMMFETLTGLMMAMMLDNAGGAWDNAKKYIEAGAHGGKGSEAHMASVTGDTVGDPFKDTAGPALHVIITTMTTTCLVLGPVFIGQPGGTSIFGARTSELPPLA